jgi:hypothetical protein
MTTDALVKQRLGEAVARLASTDAAERNDAAIKLMDLGDAAAVEPLVAAIELPSNRSARGTLVYALSAFRCDGRFLQLLSWACEGAYEVAVASMSIVEDQGLAPSPAQLAQCEAVVAELQKRALAGDHRAGERLALIAPVIEARGVRLMS